MVKMMDHPTRCMVAVKIPRQLFNFEKKIPLCTTLKHYEEYGGVQPNQIDTCLFKGETVEAVITVVMNLAQMVPTLIGTPSSETQYHPTYSPSKSTRFTDFAGFRFIFGGNCVRDQAVRGRQKDCSRPPC